MLWPSISLYVLPKLELYTMHEYCYNDHPQTENTVTGSICYAIIPDILSPKRREHWHERDPNHSQSRLVALVSAMRVLYASICVASCMRFGFPVHLKSERLEAMPDEPRRWGEAEGVVTHQV